MSEIKTLTQVQEDAITYLHRTKRPNDFRVKRKANRMVREFCLSCGFSETEANQCVRDMRDVYELERDAG